MIDNNRISFEHLQLNGVEHPFIDIYLSDAEDDTANTLADYTAALYNPLTA